ARMGPRPFGPQPGELGATPRGAAAVLGGLGGLLDEPLADMSFVPLHLLSCAARRTVTVALTGDGGDELFAGYPTMAADWWQRAARGLPRGLLGVLRRGARVLPHAAAPLGEFIAATAYHPDACNQALIGGIPPARGAALLTRDVRARLGRFDW